MIAANIAPLAIFKSLHTLPCLLDDTLSGKTHDNIPVNLDEDDEEDEDEEDEDAEDEDAEDEDAEDEDAEDESRSHDDDIGASHDNISLSVLIRLLLLTGWGIPVVLLTRDDTSSELLT